MEFAKVFQKQKAYIRAEKIYHIKIKATIEEEITKTLLELMSHSEEDSDDDEDEEEGEIKRIKEE